LPKKEIEELYIPSRNSFRRLIVHHAAKYNTKNVYSESSNNGVTLIRATKKERERRLTRKIDEVSQFIMLDIISSDKRYCNEFIDESRT